jgi:hypothetical protein
MRFSYPRARLLLAIGFVYEHPLMRAEWLKHTEQVVMSVPGAEARLEAIRNRLRGIAAQQAAAKP